MKNKKYIYRILIFKEKHSRITVFNNLFSVITIINSSEFTLSLSQRFYALRFKKRFGCFFRNLSETYIYFKMFFMRIYIFVDE